MTIAFPLQDEHGTSFIFQGVVVEQYPDRVVIERIEPTPKLLVPIDGKNKSHKCSGCGGGQQVRPPLDHTNFNTVSTAIGSTMGKPWWRRWVFNPNQMQIEYRDYPGCGCIIWLKTLVAKVVYLPGWSK